MSVDATNATSARSATAPEADGETLHGSAPLHRILDHRHPRGQGRQLLTGSGHDDDRTGHRPGEHRGGAVSSVEPCHSSPAFGSPIRVERPPQAPRPPQSALRDDRSRTALHRRMGRPGHSNDSHAGSGPSDAPVERPSARRPAPRIGGSRKNGAQGGSNTTRTASPGDGAGMSIGRWASSDTAPSSASTR